MEKIAIIIILIMALLSFFIFFIIGRYNKMKFYVYKIENKWNDIYILIKEELNLLVKIVDYLKEDITYEEVLYNDIILFKNDYLNLSNINDKLMKYNQIEEYFSKLFELGDNNVKISNDVEFNLFKEEAKKIKDKIKYSKEFYNNEVNIYTKKTSGLISNLLCKVFSFQKYNIFK